MPVRPLARACVALLLLLALLVPIADAGAATTAQASPPAGALTATQSRQLLGILHDPAKLKAFTSTLELMDRGVAATQPSGVAAKAGLAPNSLGADLIEGVGGLGTTVQSQFLDLAHIGRQFRVAGPWLHQIARDTARRSLVLGSLLRVTLLIGGSIAAVIVVRRLLRRPIGALDRLASAKPPPPENGDANPDTDPEAVQSDADGVTPLPGLEPPASSADETEEAKRRSRHNLNYRRMIHALRRLPLAAMRLLLELVPVVVFVLAAGLLQAAGIVRTDEGDLVVQVAIRTFVIAGVLIALVRTLFAASTPALRLILVRDRTAREVEFWLRVMLVTGAVGFSVVRVLQSLGMDTPSALALTRFVVLLEHTLLACLIFRIRREVAARLQPPRRVHGMVRRSLALVARRWWVVAIFFDFAFWLVWATQIRHGYARLWTFTIDTALVLVVARLVAIGLLGALSNLLRIEALAREDESERLWLRARLRTYYPILRRGVGTLVAAGTAIALLQIWGIGAFSWFRGGALGGRLISALVSVLVTLAIGVIVWEALNLAFDRQIAKLEHDPEAGPARIARLTTLLPILRITMFIVIATILLLTVLTQIGVNVAPLLGGAGILGVAIGFGSQKLVQDFITGIFLLLENTMQVGDFVTAAGLSGSVEHLSIRTLRLRAGDGSVHMIPFSSVTTVTNVNRGQGNAAVSVDIAPHEDTDRAGDVLKRIVLGMREDPDYADGMLTDLQFWGVDKVTSQAVTLVGQIGCTDKARWGVQREFNRRMRIDFADAGIALASPNQSVTLQREPPPRDDTHVPSSLAPEAATGTVVESPPPAALGAGA